VWTNKRANINDVILTAAPFNGKDVRSKNENNHYFTFWFFKLFLTSTDPLTQSFTSFLCHSISARSQIHKKPPEVYQTVKPLFLERLFKPE
jgi:hypothetical protein